VGRNGEFCVAVGPATRTVDTLTSRLKALAVNGAGHPADLACMLAFGLTLASSKGMISHATDFLGQCKIFFFYDN